MISTYLNTLVSSIIRICFCIEIITLAVLVHKGTFLKIEGRADSETSVVSGVLLWLYAYESTENVPGVLLAC